MTIPSLPHHVLGIVFLGSQEKVIDVDAATVVSLVADAQIIFYRAVGSNPCQPMNSYRPTTDACDSVAL